METIKKMGVITMKLKRISAALGSIALAATLATPALTASAFAANDEAKPGISVTGGGQFVRAATSYAPEMDARFSINASKDENGEVKGSFQIIEKESNARLEYSVVDITMFGDRAIVLIQDETGDVSPAFFIDGGTPGSEGDSIGIFDPGGIGILSEQLTGGNIQVDGVNVPNGNGNDEAKPGISVTGGGQVAREATPYTPEIDARFSINAYRDENGEVKGHLQVFEKESNITFDYSIISISTSGNTAYVIVKDETGNYYPAFFTDGGTPGSEGDSMGIFRTNPYIWGSITGGNIQVDGIS